MATLATSAEKPKAPVKYDYLDKRLEAGEQGTLTAFEKMEYNRDEFVSEAEFVEFWMRAFIPLGENGDATCARHWQEVGFTPW